MLDDEKHELYRALLYICVVIHDKSLPAAAARFFCSNNKGRKILLSFTMHGLDNMLNYFDHTCTSSASNEQHM